MQRIPVADAGQQHTFALPTWRTCENCNTRPQCLQIPPAAPVGTLGQACQPINAPHASSTRVHPMHCPLPSTSSAPLPPCNQCTVSRPPPSHSLPLALQTSPASFARSATMSAASPAAAMSCKSAMSRPLMTCASRPRLLASGSRRCTILYTSSFDSDVGPLQANRRVAWGAQEVEGSQGLTAHAKPRLQTRLVTPVPERRHAAGRS